MSDGQTTPIAAPQCPRDRCSGGAAEERHGISLSQLLAMALEATRVICEELNAAPSQCEAAVAAQEPPEVAAILFGKLAKVWRRDVVERRDTRCQGARPARRGAYGDLRSSYCSYPPEDPRGCFFGPSKLCQLL